MPDHTRWVAFRLAIVAVAVLSVAFARTPAVSAYDTVGLASTAAAVGENAVQDTVPASAGRGSATVGVDAVVDMLPPDGTTSLVPHCSCLLRGDAHPVSGLGVLDARLHGGTILRHRRWGCAASSLTMFGCACAPLPALP